MKAKKVQSDNTVNEQEAPDALICNRCKGIFTNVNVKIICHVIDARSGTVPNV